MSRDRLLRGDEVDAFELGDCDENGVKRSGETSTARRIRDRLVGRSMEEQA